MAILNRAHVARNQLRFEESERQTDKQTDSQLNAERRGGLIAGENRLNFEFKDRRLKLKLISNGSSLVHALVHLGLLKLADTRAQLRVGAGTF